MESSQPISNIIELLRSRALENPNFVAYRYLGDGENETATLTFVELDRQARTIGAWLRQITKPGDRVIILYTSGFEPVIGLFGCLYSNTVAVPSLPVQPNRPPDAFMAMLHDAQANVVLTTTAEQAIVQPLVDSVPDAPPLSWVATDALDPALAADWQMPEISPESPFVIMYTSGSTGAPRGVFSLHETLSAVVTLSMSMELDLGSLLVWAPLYHGSGLMSAGLVPLMYRAPLFLIPPIAVMERPLRLLKAISRYQITSCGGPNFIYQYCVDRVTPEERVGLDLSSWTRASSGGEPVRQSTVQQFADAYEPYGFRRGSFSTGYGLSESGLQGTVSFGFKAQGFDRDTLFDRQVMPCDETDPGAVVLVSNGFPLPTMEILIVDPDTCLKCPPDRVGEVWMAGLGVAAGYWNNPEETVRIFHARVADTGAGPYLRTGDLGFFYEDEIYIAGRIKETIIVHGHNYYAQDIETAVGSSHPDLQPAASAAFSAPIGAEERVVIFQELKENLTHVDAEAITQAIRHAAAEKLELSLYAVVLVKAGALPRTGTGKIRRNLVRSQYLESQSSDQLV